MVKNLDIFGQSVTFTFRKKPTFQTWGGACISCFVLTLFIAFCGVRTLKLYSASDPFFSMMTMAKEEVDPIDLAALDFMFAIEQVDPRVARVVVTHVQWGPGKNEYDESTGDVLYKDKQYKEIEMIDCMKLKDDPDFENFHDSTKLLV